MKLNYIEWYLVELRQCLTDEVRIEKQNSLMFETRNHLESLVEEFRKQGMDEKSSQLAAIERFGTPGCVAQNFVDGSRRVNNQKLSLLCGVLLTVFTIYFVVMAMMEPRMERFSGWYMPGLWGSILTRIGSPLILGYVGYTLILKRAPKALWYLLPVIVTLVIGPIFAYKWTFYAGLNAVPRPVNYAQMHFEHRILTAQNEKISKVEHQAVQLLRAELASTNLIDKLKEGATFSISEASYNKVGIGNEMSEDDQRFSQTVGQIYPMNRSASIAKITLKGPISGHKIRETILGKIASCQWQNRLRGKTIAEMAAGLNLPVKTRLELFIQPLIGSLLLFHIPACWLTCFIIAKLRSPRRNRFRRTELA